MTKLSTLTPARPKSALKTRSAKADTLTYEGGAGFSRKPKTELFLFAISNMVAEDTFYEAAPERDARFRELIAKVTKSDPDWIARFVPYLRNTMNMRSASIVMAVEYVIAGGPHGRKVINSAIARADEPGEVLGYYRSRVGRSVPQPIKRGIADAAARLYNERNVIRYKDRGAYKISDVLRITHPKPIAQWQSDLFASILVPEYDPKVLPVIKAYRDLLAMPVQERRAVLDTPERLQDAGMTWESIAGWLQGPMDAQAWEAVIPSMGYMALLRNLRNFEDANISDSAKARVISRLTDPDEVVKSRQFPIRFYSAIKNVRGFDFYPALERALGYTLANVPSLTGKTLILVDNSGSMSSRLSGKSTLTLREVAGLFGSALALRAADADLIPYSDVAKPKVVLRRPVLAVTADATRYDGGTRTLQVVRDTFSGHDRIIILTDEQAFHGPEISDIKVPVYTFNLAGYKAGHLPSGTDNRYTFGGGLTDAAFSVIPLLEAGKNADWPF